LKDILLITPPFTQLNTPYPATAYLKGFLNTKGISSFQMDLAIEVLLNLYSKKQLTYLFSTAFENDRIISENATRIYHLREDYLKLIDDVIAFLQGKNKTLARQLCTDSFLPRAARFDQLDDMDWAFGNMGQQDKAKHFATLFLEDISDFIVECVDENFGFSRYAEQLGMSANSFDELYGELQQEITFIDTITLEILSKRIESIQPKLVCLSVPFPGNLYSAFRCAQFIKTNYPHIAIAMGGGYPNTELRSVNDKRVFEFVDYITLDDGELPIELLHKKVLDPNHTELKRTFLLENGVVTYNNSSSKADYKQAYVGTPDYSDLLLENYLSVIEIANPMHSLWSDGRWNKLTMAHGCYWGKCTFCDISLDYIKLYEPVAASMLVDRMEQIIEQTGESGFHFVDEAAPPALMKSLALEIIKRNLIVTWWTNIRFEKSFTSDLCQLLKASGCIAVSGGLEVASDRLLNLIDKGVSVAQVAQVAQNFTDSDIMVHSYLMFGFPTQTQQETMDSLEMVRQLFELGIIQSGFWHQFSLTAHSPIGKKPEDYGLTPRYEEINFANNDIQFTDQTGIDHTLFSFGLKKSLFNFMHGIGFELSVNDWFDFKVPATTIPPTFIEQCLQQSDAFVFKPNAKIIWLGNQPISSVFTKRKQSETWEMMELSFFSKINSFSITVDAEQGRWLEKTLRKVTVFESPKTLAELKHDFEIHLENFELFWFSKAIIQLKKNGFLTL